ncbi:MAG: hypothetical protein PHR84_04195 [Candidatus Omnitrophica bacterium]|nr:hypothetical protein [Candidatus Omnitrophota bacterium]MDD5660318.1 hypothetical protein [Candidatus Omnitrophota bacterium]
MKNILICMIFVVVALCATNASAATSQTVNVNATVPTMTGGLSVTVSRVTGDVWTSATAISFGTLVWDTVNKIFLPSSYFAVDIGVTDNSGTAWTVTHTRTSLARSAGGNLDNKVNVSFVKQTSSTASTDLQKVSFGNSQSIGYTKAQLAGGWLRIYYGIGTGDPTKPDAPGVTPIGLDTAAGTYNGTVTITLTP